MKSWRGVGEAYASSYAALCVGTADALIAALGPSDGRTLLDVGSGTGLLAARFADAGWDVTGCEPERTMRDVASRLHPDVPVVDGALPDLPFDRDLFAAVTANFVLNHVRDPRASARDIARVAASRAPLAATIWVASPSWFWVEVCVRAGLTPTTGEPLAPEMDFERTSEGFGSMLAEGGWQRVGVTELTWTWRAPAAGLWASAEGGVASAGMFYQGLDASDRASFRRAFDELCAERSAAGAIPLEHTAAVAVGHAP